ncbi:MAG: YigZ family protein, partial [Comamonas sp.]
MPYSLAAPVHSELVIKKSRFIGCVQVVADRAEAQRIVTGLRAQHPGCAHVCWALMAGGQSAAVDDGEPGGTAGRPMLDVLRHQDMEGVLATVVRYFGGVKLGAGGLVRAYTDAIAQALLQAEKIPRIA